MISLIMNDIGWLLWFRGNYSLGGLCFWLTLTKPQYSIEYRYGLNYGELDVLPIGEDLG